MNDASAENQKGNSKNAPTLRNFEESIYRDTPTFGDFAAEWLQTCVVGGGLTESQIESDQGILQKHLLPYFGQKSLADINGRMIDRYKAQKRTERHQFGEGYAPKSINNHLSVLHRIFEKAIEYEILGKNPITKRAWMRIERTSEDRLNWWTPQQEKKAIDTLNRWKDAHPERRLVILLQVMTGMRFSEIRALERRDIDFAVPGVWVRRAMARKKTQTPKNKRARFHAIPKGLAEQLAEWVAAGDKGDDAPEGLLFVGPKGGPLANNSLNRWYRKLAEEAQIRPISSHGARHTSGSTYASMGVGQKMIAKLLGHASSKATERYTHIQVGETRGVVEERWGRVLMVE